MIIYKDIITGCELFSDSYPMSIVDDIFYKVVGKRVTESGGIDESKIGGNASAEDGAEALEEASRTDVNIVIAHNLNETPYGSKKDYQTDLKAYMGKIVKKLEASNPDRIADFKKAALAAVKTRVIDHFKDFQFYRGENDDELAGMVALLNYEEDGVTPYFLFFKDGVCEEKF